MDLDRQSDIAALDTTLTTVERVLDIDGLRAKIEKLEHEAADPPNLWNDQSHAQRVTSELSHAQGELRRVEGLRSRLEDLPVLYELAAEEGGDDELAEADAELKSLQADIEQMEVRTCCPASTTSARPSSPSAPVRVASTPPIGPRC